MKTIKNQTFDEERALYGSDGVVLEGLRFRRSGGRRECIEGEQKYPGEPYIL